MRGFSLLLLRNLQGRILMQLRTDDAPTFPDCWGFFGGAIDEGENPVDAVIREAREELGYQCRDPRLLCSVHPDSLDYPLNGGQRHYFVETVDASQRLRLAEGKSMGWFSLDEMRGIRLAPHNHEVIDIIRRELDGGGTSGTRSARCRSGGGQRR